MASKTPHLGGQDFDFIEEPPDSLKCLICMMVVKEPWQHGECGRVYCRICIQEYKKVKDTCPNCRQENPSLFKDGRSEIDIRALLVRCSNHCDQDASDTCKWVGELGDLERHLSSCPLEQLRCPNKCIRNGQAVKVARQHLQGHLDKECPNRFYMCPHCRKEGKYLELTTAHAEKCPRIPVHCPNSPCTAVVIRDKLELHNQSECLYTTVPCSQSDIGCTATPSRKELNKHETDADLHLETARGTIAALKRQVSELKEGMAKIEVRMKREMVNAVDRAHMLLSGQATFKIPSFSTYKTSSTEFKSQPFYTRRQGYKLCVIVEANGMSKVRGAYMSVYAHLMRGEHDDHLLWPLVGTVTFELLNQLGNHNHRKMSCVFPADDKDNHRLFHQEIADAGYGCPKFISHSKLGLAGGVGVTRDGFHDMSKDVQYLKDDTIYLRVAVAALEPVDYDWLKCYNFQ